MVEDTHKKSMKPIVQATLIAGALDIGSAFAYAMLDGHRPLGVLIGIASAVWPGARQAVFAGIFVGLLVHFAIMSVMVSVYMTAAGRMQWARQYPVLAGSLYGLVLWSVMYLVVLPWRWPSLFPHLTAMGVTEQLFSHMVLVGIPIAWLARSVRPRLAPAT